MNEVVGTNYINYEADASLQVIRIAKLRLSWGGKKEKKRKKMRWTRRDFCDGIWTLRRRAARSIVFIITLQHLETPVIQA